MKKIAVLTVLLVSLTMGLAFIGAGLPARAAEDPQKELMGAAVMGELDRVKSLVEAGADVNYQEENSRATPLIGACWRGHEEVIKYLVARGADVNVQNANGDTPLMLAAGSKQFKTLVPWLLARGADAAAVRNDNMNAVWNLVVKVERYNVPDLVKTVNLLVDRGAAVNLTINGDFTPLMFASRAGCLEMVQCLVKNGAEVNRETGDGRTPLHLAQKEGHAPVVSFLQSKGAAE